MKEPGLLGRAVDNEEWTEHAGTRSFGVGNKSPRKRARKRTENWRSLQTTNTTHQGNLLHL